MKKVRGYIFSRPFMGERVPQHVQNLVIRDYCHKKKLQYLLSSTEYSMPGCYYILKNVIDELNKMHGIVAYSLYQLPEITSERNDLVKIILDQGKTFYFAVEGLQLGNAAEYERIENLWRVKQTLPYCLNNFTSLPVFDPNFMIQNHNI